MGLEIINKLKKEKGLTSEQLSNMSGVPLGTLNKILNGITKDPKLKTLKSLARVLDCNLDDFDDDIPKKDVSNITANNLILSKVEINLIKKYRKLPDNRKNDVIKYIDMFYDEECATTESDNYIIKRA